MNQECPGFGVSDKSKTFSLFTQVSVGSLPFSYIDCHLTLFLTKNKSSLGDTVCSYRVPWLPDCLHGIVSSDLGSGLPVWQGFCVIIF